MQKKNSKTRLNSKIFGRHELSPIIKPHERSPVIKPIEGAYNLDRFTPVLPVTYGTPGSPSYEAAKVADKKNNISFDIAHRSASGRQYRDTAFLRHGVALGIGQRHAPSRTNKDRWYLNQEKATIADECWELGWARTDQLVRLIDLDRKQLAELFDSGKLGKPVHTLAGFIWRWQELAAHTNLLISTEKDYIRRSKEKYDEIKSFFESYVEEQISERTNKLRFIFDFAHQADDAFLDKIISMINGDFKSPGTGPSPLKILEQMPDDERLAPPSVYWKDRGKHPELKNASIPEFMRAVYGARLGRGFTRADLRNVDEGLYSILKEWQRRANPEKPGYINQLPGDIDLPTLEEWNNRQLETSGLSMMIEDPRFRNLLGVAATRARQKNPKI